jgi:AcrR family transcriptional regulator
MSDDLFAVDRFSALVRVDNRSGLVISTTHKYHDRVTSPKIHKRAYNTQERQHQSDRTRRKLVTAARWLVGRRDGAFTMDEVAKRAGVTRLTVYHQFESRAGLLDAVFDDIAEKTGLVSAIPSVFAQRSGQAAFRRLAQVFADFWSSHQTRLPGLRSRHLDAELRERMAARSERRRVILATLFERFGRPTLGTQERDELIDIVFGLTSFEYYDLVGGRNRSHARRAAILVDLVGTVVEPHLAAADNSKTARSSTRQVLAR